MEVGAEHMGSTVVGNGTRLFRVQGAFLGHREVLNLLCIRQKMQVGRWMDRQMANGCMSGWTDGG